MPTLHCYREDGVLQQPVPEGASWEPDFQNQPRSAVFPLGQTADWSAVEKGVIVVVVAGRAVTVGLVLVPVQVMTGQVVFPAVAVTMPNGVG